MNGRRPNGAVALLVTLAFIVLITVLVAGMAGSMRTDRPAANSSFEKTRSELYAQTAVERVVATLRQYTSDPDRNWISQPGQLVIANSGSNIIQTPVSLSSGAFSGGVLADYLEPPDLNIRSLSGINQHLITDRPDPVSPGNAIAMRVNWVYVRESGELDTSEIPQTDNVGDPIVGRYAYWTDDESGKINYNLAWGRDTNPVNTDPPGHPSEIDLTALTGMTQGMANEVHKFIVSNLVSGGHSYRFFNTPQEAQRVNPDIASILRDNKFEVTHYNHDPNTTFFNEPRIVLTTRPDRAGWSYKNGQWVGANGLAGAKGRPIYLRILKNEGSDTAPPQDPGKAFDYDSTWRLVSSLDESKVSETMNLLLTYMQRRDWPIVSGTASIQDKYYSGNEKRLAQLAVNIIDYVRSKESALLLVDPLRPRQNGANAPYTYDIPRVGGVGSTTAVYIGITRTPRITEMGLWLPATPASRTATTATYNGAKLKVEVHLPRDFGIEEINLDQIQFWATYNDRVAPVVNNEQIAGVGVSGENAPEVIPRFDGDKSTVLQCGQYRTIVRTITVTAALPALELRPTSIKLRAAIARLPPSSAPAGTHGGRLDIVPLLGDSPLCTIDDPAVLEENIKSLQVDDPRVNAHKNDWRTAQNTFGSAPAPAGLASSTAGVSTLGQGSSSVPQQDTDRNGRIVDTSLYMPPPAGRRFTRGDEVEDDNTMGKVSSAGELGYVHTGMESSTGGGVPWRTLRLQPSNHSTGTIPDWAFIDLFTAPPDAPTRYNKYVYAPHGTGFGGRVNMNAKAAPFSLNRLIPLAAVLKGCAHGNPAITGLKLTAKDAERIAQDIHDRTLARNGKAYGYLHGYDSPGEVVEIRGVADSGESSEELVRQITNLVTSRGNVFSIYTVGQAVKQTSKGKLVVTGEGRIQAMVERYLEPASNEVRFRSVYYRNLTR